MSGPDFSRAQRVADQLRRELADLLVREAKDPRFTEVTVSDVRVSRDLAHAKVYVTLHADSDTEHVVRALNGATGYLRRGLAQRMHHMRYLPQIRFVHDPTLNRATHLDELIDTALQEDEARRARKHRSGSGKG